MKNMSKKFEINPLAPELIYSAQRCLMKFLLGILLFCTAFKSAQLRVIFIPQGLSVRQLPFASF
jgi:hypothetical protein